MLSPMNLHSSYKTRESRTWSNQSMGGSPSLHQIKPLHTEALPAGKPENRAKSKSGNHGSMNSSDGYTNCHESVAERRCVPVIVKTLSRANSTFIDGSAPTSSHLVLFKGQTTEVPDKIRCHRCKNPMKLGTREIRYKGEKRKYVTYRCTHYGCNTFRSVRKVIAHGVRRRPKRRPKRSISESSDDGNASPESDVTLVQQPYHSDTDSDAEGTLSSIPDQHSPNHLEAMLNFTYNLLGGANSPAENSPTTQLVQVDMNDHDISGPVRSEEEQKEFHPTLMTASRPPANQFVTKACESLENTHAMAQGTSTDDTPVFDPQLDNATFYSSTVPPVQLYQMSSLPNYNQSALYSESIYTSHEDLCWPNAPREA